MGGTSSPEEKINQESEIGALSLAFLNAEEETPSVSLTNNSDPLLTFDDMKVKNIYINIQEISATADSGVKESIVKFPSGKIVDLHKIKKEGLDSLGKFNLKPGTYKQLTVVISSENTIITEDDKGKSKQDTLRLSSDANANIEVGSLFETFESKRTSLDLKFDISSVNHSKEHGWSFKPKIKVVKAVPAPKGGICSSNTILAGPMDGELNSFKNIESALNAASANWKIVLGKNHFPNPIFIKDKSNLTITSECESNLRSITLISSNNILISKLSFSNIGHGHPAIELTKNNSNILIEDVSISCSEKASVGIHVKEHNSNIEILDSDITECDHAAILIDDNTESIAIARNNIAKNGNGIEIKTKSDTLEISENDVKENFHYGVLFSTDHDELSDHHGKRHRSTKDSKDRWRHHKDKGRSKYQSRGRSKNQNWRNGRGNDHHQEEEEEEEDPDVSIRSIIANNNISKNREDGVKTGKNRVQILLDNSIASNGGNGVSLNKSFDVELEGNKINLNQRNGIEIDPHTISTTIYNNGIKYNNYHGIYSGRHECRDLSTSFLPHEIVIDANLIKGMTKTAYGSIVVGRKT